jgi:hypothetical protein
MSTMYDREQLMSLTNTTVTVRLTDSLRPPYQAPHIDTPSRHLEQQPTNHIADASGEK